MKSVQHTGSQYLFPEQMDLNLQVLLKMILTFSLPFGMQKVILFASIQIAVCDVFTQAGIPITLYSFPIFILFTDSSKIIKDKRKYVFT